MDEVVARLRQRLEGLSDDEYLWEPVPGCWTVHRDGSAGAIYREWAFGQGKPTSPYGR